MQALQKGKYQVLSAGESRLRVVAAGVLAAVVARLPDGRRVAHGVLRRLHARRSLAALLLGPLLSLALARALRPVLKWLRPVEGALAADSLIQAPRRTSASVAALMLSLALVVAFAGMARASYTSIIDWMDTTLNPDLFVMPSQDIVIRTLRFPPEMEAELRRMPGIDARADGPQRARRVPEDAGDDRRDRHREHRRNGAARRRSPAMPRTMYREDGGGRGPDGLGQPRRSCSGSRSATSSRSRRRTASITLPIVGIVAGLLGSAGHDSDGPQRVQALLARRLGQRCSASIWRPAPTVPDVKRRILERYAGERQVFVLTNGELKAYILRITDQWFGADVRADCGGGAGRDSRHRQHADRVDHRPPARARRAAGGRRAARPDPADDLDGGAQHRRRSGLILGFALGAVNLYYILEIVHRDIAGMRLDYAFPVPTLWRWCRRFWPRRSSPRIWPAESAVHGSLVEALEYE